ncbi:MAG: LysR family transcriptional regulator [Candidatus Choladocola sp.]|nr:LysR family transcriptional regulator [Candidatus Choladocola sp.]
MDLKNLNTFIHVAELSSFTKAASRLGYSQSTVSFQIRQLETELNAQLFERINHTVVLTERGKEVLKYAQQIGHLTRELKENMQNSHEVCGHVRLAMADSLSDSLLDDRFADFRRRYPQITLKIIAAGTEEMFRLINQNEVDAILTLDNHIYDTEYVIVKEKKVRMHFVAGAEASCRDGAVPGEPVSLEELLCCPFLLTEKGMSYRRMLDEKLAGMSLEIHPILEIGSTRLISNLVEQGIGVSFLPDYVTESEVAAGRMRYLDVREPEIEVWKQLLYHRDKWVSPQLESVLQYCVEREFSD